MSLGFASLHEDEIKTNNYDVWENTTAEYPLQIQGLAEATWTRIDSVSYELLEFECIYETLVCLAKSTTDADTKFAANQYTMLAANTAYSVQPRQGQNAYNIYAKCWVANDKSDTLDAAVAVDKSTTPATVGVPITGHTFVAGDIVTIAGTTAYDGTYRVYSKSANEIVIFATYTAETFAGTDTIVSAPSYIIKTAR